MPKSTRFHTRTICQSYLNIWFQTKKLRGGLWDFLDTLYIKKTKWKMTNKNDLNKMNLKNNSPSAAMLGVEGLGLVIHLGLLLKV